jgi:hypothetical protein
MKAATNTSGKRCAGFPKPDVKSLIHQPTERIKFVRRFGRTIESRLQLLLFGVPNHLVFFFGYSLALRVAAHTASAPMPRPIAKPRATERSGSRLTRWAASSIKSSAA